MTSANSENKPVMIGEATPQFVGADNENDWDSWFAPYFERINRYPGIKACTYINWNWAATHKDDGWNDWGDARLENAASNIKLQYLNEIRSSRYIHAKKSHLKLFADNQNESSSD